MSESGGEVESYFECKSRDVGSNPAAYFGRCSSTVELC